MENIIFDTNVQYLMTNITLELAVSSFIIITDMNITCRIDNSL